MAVGSDQEKTVSPPNIVAARSMLYPGECNQFTLLWLKALAKFRTVQRWSYGSLMHAYTNFNTADQPFSLGSPISEFRREIANLCNWNWHGPQKSAQGTCNQFALLWLRASSKIGTMRQWAESSVMWASTNFYTADWPFFLRSHIGKFRREIANLCNWDWHGPQNS
ncbi:hypothetical protein B0H10DRAFT_1974467 [Mycena sp. CBHHK59/15]|nr:hypothetical protein B0H10DRAFT_1974467 [Mycena sp. CBHHK59/15]